MADGRLQPGGAALYGALTAARLGFDARISTSHGDDFSGAALLAEAGVTVFAAPAPATTCFENRYDGAGRRRARVTAVAGPLDRPATADVIFACPVIGEVAPAALAGPLVGAGLQGWMRRLDAAGEVHAAPLGDPGFLRGCRALFASDEDLGDDAPRLVPALTALVPIVVVTHGAAGADVIVAGAPERIPAVPAREIDPTGAGDVFAATFLCALFHGATPLAAARHAAAAAAVAVEGPGPSPLTRLAAPVKWMTD